MERTTCQNCTSLRQLNEGFKKVIGQRGKRIAEQKKIIEQLKELVKFTEIQTAAGMSPAKT